MTLTIFDLIEIAFACNLGCTIALMVAYWWGPLQRLDDIPSLIKDRRHD